MYHRLSLTVVAVFSVVLWASVASAADKGPRSCGNESLQGGFGITAKGVSSDGKPAASVGRVYFDGKGSFTAKGAFSDNGAISNDVDVSGHYSVRPDCTGDIVYDDGSTNLIVPAGYFAFGPATGEIRLVSRDTKVVVDFVAKKQFLREAPRKCSTKDLKGKFISSGGGPIIDKGMNFGAGIIDFDGAGQMDVDRTINFNGNVLQNKTFHAKYEVGADCSGKLSYASEKEFLPVAGTTYDSFVVDADGREVRIFSANPGRVLTVMAEKQFK